VYCLKVPFLRTVKYNNFVPYHLSLYNCAHEIGTVTLKEKRFALKRNSVALKSACCGEEEGKYCCFCCCCHGAQNISVTNKSEEICVQIFISI